jgi:hypothetical protein
VQIVFLFSIFVERVEINLRKLVKKGPLYIQLLFIPKFIFIFILLTQCLLLSNFLFTKKKYFLEYTNTLSYSPTLVPKYEYTYSFSNVSLSILDYLFCSWITVLYIYIYSDAFQVAAFPAASPIVNYCRYV